MQCWCVRARAEAHGHSTNDTSGKQTNNPNNKANSSVYTCGPSAEAFIRDDQLIFRMERRERGNKKQGKIKCRWTIELQLRNRLKQIGVEIMQRDGKWDVFFRINIQFIRSTDFYASVNRISLKSELLLRAVRDDRDNCVQINMQRAPSYEISKKNYHSEKIMDDLYNGLSNKKKQKKHFIIKK